MHSDVVRAAPGDDAPPDDGRVLLVDDDPLTRRRLEIVLAQAGFAVTSLASSREALERLERDFHPLLLTDWNMPGMDGIALCRSVRELPWEPAVYTVLMTMRDADGDLAQALDAGADDFISKRVPDSHLLARLQTGRRIVALQHALRAVGAENRLLTLSDPITGVGNRRHLMQQLPRELQRARRYGRALSLLACGIDQLGEINETHGHDIADEVLQACAARLGAAVRSDPDWISRVGGEEFVIVLPETSPAQAVAAADRLRSLLAESPLRTSGPALQVTLSIGVAGTADARADGTRSANDLLSRAARGLERSRTGGGNRVHAAE